MGHKKEEVIAYDTDGPYVFSSLTLCASAYGMSRKKLISLIKSGSTWDGDARTTFDVPCYSTLDLGDEQ